MTELLLLAAGCILGYLFRWWQSARWADAQMKVAEQAIEHISSMPIEDFLKENPRESVDLAARVARTKQLTGQQQ